MSQDSFKVKKSLVTKAISRPSNPENGEIYFDSVQNKHFFFGNGSWAEIGAGVLNYVSNPNAEAGVSGWVTYADAAQANPVDGTGGSPSITLTRTTSTPLRGTGSFLLTKDASNRQGQGVSTDIAVDRADQSQLLQVSFDFQIASGAYLDGDIRVFLYDITNSELIQLSVRDLPANRPFYTFNAFAQIPSNSTSYRLIMHIASTSASAYSIKFDNVSISPASSLSLDVKNISLNAELVSNVTPGSGNAIAFDSVSFDTAGAYNSTSGQFTAPESGYYLVTSNVILDAAADLGVYKNNSLVSYLASITTSMNFVGGGSIIVSCEAGDVLHVGINSGAQVNGSTSPNYSQLSIQKVMSNVTSEGSLIAAKYSSNSLGVSPGITDLIFEDLEYDTNSAYNTTTGIYTVPSTGKYRISSVVTTSSISLSLGNLLQLFVDVNSGASNDYLDMAPIQSTTSNNYTLSGSVTLDLIAADQVKLRFNNTSGSGFALNADGDTNYFCIERIFSPAELAAREVACVSLQLGNGWGSTADKVRRFTNVIKNVGTSISYVDSSTNGATFTINTQGIYSISYTDNSSAGAVQIAVTKNDTELTVVPFAMANPSEILVCSNSSGANVGDNLCVTVPLDAGDVIRAKGEGLASAGINAIETFTITKVG